MKDFWRKSAVSFLIIIPVFILDTLTPRGFGIWILYMIPISMHTYKTSDRAHTYIISSAITVLIWSGYYIKAPGTIAPQLALTNRVFITLALWIITYVQIQRSGAHKELLKSEEELRKSEERFRIAQEVSPDGFVTFIPKLDAAGQVVDFIFTFENEAAARMNGTRPKEVIGHGMLELFPGQKDTQFFRTYKEVYETKKTVEFIDHYRGETFTDDIWFRVVAVPTSEGIAINAQNITEQKISEEALRESQKKLIEAQRIAHIGSYILNYKNNTIEYSEELYRIFGWDPLTKTVTYDDVMNSIHPDDFEVLTETIRKSVEEKTSIEMDYRIVTGNGEIKYLHTRRNPVFDSNGNLIGAFGTSIDITQRKLQELRLEEANRKFQESEARLLEAQKLARLGNYSIDFKNGGKMEWSDEMYNIWELDRSKPLPGVDEVWKNVHPDDLDELKRVLYSQLPGGERVETVFRILFPGGRVKYVHLITKVTFDDIGNLLRREGIEMDITERKMAQIELERTLRQLARSNRELEQFAYIASHDLQEPLRMVSSYLGMLEKKYGHRLDEKAKGFINFAVDGSKRMSRLIKDLLTYSRVTTQAKEFTDVDLNEILGDVTHDLQVLIKEKGAGIHSEKLPVIKADPVQIHQLLQNIIGNAIKFRGERTPEINLRAEAAESGWLFSVEDNGIGIDPQFFDRIFQIFQRLHEQAKYPGTGIGLALCKKIVERHGGRIWVESQQGRGSTFYFTLPNHL
ncbi:MAG TPA: ATP-binding protein [Ignavibacteriales bacterium]|nr:ATP-binding protein [Ignavibacteriales bacterium]